jgi:hypothetical protein
MFRIKTVFGENLPAEPENQTTEATIRLNALNRMQLLKYLTPMPFDGLDSWTDCSLVLIFGTKPE